MWNTINLQECLARIKAKDTTTDRNPATGRPAITISQMSGTGGDSVAAKLLDYLKPHTPPGYQWAIYDKNFMVKVLEDHGLSKMLADSLPEAKEPLLTELINRLHGGHPSAAKIAQLAVETVWHLAEGGCVILVGRAANVITAELKTVFHVRLVGSLDQRIEKTRQVQNVEHHVAHKQVKAEDEAKKLYVKEYFGRDIDDPELYHLIVNTDHFSPGATAKLIGDAFVNWLKSVPASATR